MQKLLTKFPRLATSGRHNFAMVTDRRKFTAKLTIYMMSSFHCTFCTRKVPTQNFRHVRCPILRIKTNSTLQCWCGLASDMLKKIRVNWKLNISNMADDAGITQSQARGTR